MRRAAGILLIVLLLPVAAASARVLHKGMHGPRVARVQRALHLPGDRVFGPATTRAVKRFQRAHGLAADGIVGPATWAALGHTGLSRTLRQTLYADAGDVVARVIRAADRIQSTPYRYGGGHRRFRTSAYD